MKNANILELKDKIQQLSDTAEEAAKPILKILETVNAAIKTNKTIAEEASSKRQYAFYKFRDEKLTKEDYFKMLDDLTPEEEKEKKANQKNILLEHVKNYYNNKITSISKYINYNLLVYLIDYKINDTRSINQFEHLIDLYSIKLTSEYYGSNPETEAKRRSVLNSNLCFYSHIDFYNRDIVTGLKTKKDQMYSNYEKEAKSSLWGYNADDGYFKDLFFTEETKNKITESALKELNDFSRYDPDYKRVMNAAAEMIQRKTEIEKKLHDLINDNTKNFNDANTYNFDLKIKL